MTKAIIMAFHKYTPFGDEFYEPILKFQLGQLQKYKDEYDKLYLIDSTWNISPATHILPDNVIVIKVNPSLRYYDAYKEILPQVKEDLVLFMDNDLVIYKPGMIKKTFDLLEYPGFTEVVSIYDTIGEFKTDKMNGKNKLCPYWFAIKKDLLMKYRDVEWGPDMPYCETLGHLTEEILKDKLKLYEWPEDKGEVDWIEGHGEVKTEEDTGTYHIRAGSTPAYLLATKHYGDIKTYDDYLKNQPHSELIRHCAWYKYMGGDPSEILNDL